MSWENENLIKRIFNVFKRSKAQIYTEDIEALKRLKEILENSEKHYVNDNILFLKLLAIHLKTELEYFRDVNFAKKNIGKALSLPISHHIEMLRLSLNEIDLQNFSKSIGFVEFKNDDDIIRNNEIINKNQKEIIERLNKFWTFEKIEDSIYKTANDFLKEINNYK